MDSEDFKDNPKSSPTIAQRYLDFTIFTSGLATMAVEFGASRLLGNVFGTSNIVWAVIIGLVLVYLTLGNWLGGKIADRYPNWRTFFVILALAGLWVGFVPIISRPILKVSANAFDAMQIPVLAGSFLAVLLLFFIPVTLLGMVTPLVLKLLIQDTERTGRISGKISAVSTLGSFVGTFLTVLVLIPLVGTYRTFIVVSLVLIGIALPGLLILKEKRLFMVFTGFFFVVLIGGLVFIHGYDKNTQGLVYEKESAYNYIQVVEIGEFRFLRLNEGQGMHSIYHPNQFYYEGPWSQVLAAPLFNPLENEGTDVDSIAILGLAAGTTARQAEAVYPQAHVDGYEIDPEIIRIGKEWFGMDLPNLTSYAQDARWGISHTDKHYDIISVDAYRPPYIPAHLVTREFFLTVYEKLNTDGVMAINVGRGPQDRRLVDAMSSTIASVFPKVFCVDLPDTYNTMVFAARSETASWEHLIQNRKNLKIELSRSLLDMAVDVTYNGAVDCVTTGQIFSDDKAPIEHLTNRLVLEFVLRDFWE